MKKGKFKIAVRYHNITRVETREGWIIEKGETIEGFKMPLSIGLHSYGGKENGKGRAWNATCLKLGLAIYTGASTRNSASLFAKVRLEALVQNKRLNVIMSRNPSIEELEASQ